MFCVCFVGILAAFVCMQAKYYGMSFTFLPDEASGSDDVFAELRAIGAVAASEDGMLYDAVDLIGIVILLGT